ncbi:MAG: GreA/GreB family elongation factor [Clostridia bacterium]|nr:GreA/GreB family elongation factor [Clostridia bacterium]
MHDELTQIDIDKMKEEIADRTAKIAGLRAAVKTARELGDLSENDEYRSAKREYNANNSRIRYLKSMIATAKVIEVRSNDGEVGLFDEIEILYIDTEEKQTVRIVTTLRNDVFSGNISKESPFGKALLGRRVGDTVTVKASEKVSYQVKILSIKKGSDDPNLPISKY